MKTFPACFLRLPQETSCRSAAFYLAIEEFVARNMYLEDAYLFWWQVSPTVVMGRNQVAHKEINIDFRLSQNIDIVRRRSGGGSVFADRGNVMWSLILKSDGRTTEDLFSEYAYTMAAALNSLGIPAVATGRNDIVLDVSVGGGKICGNAFYWIGDCCIIHGTMLYDTTMSMMTKALSPDNEKLEGAGVQSVKQRIALLKDVSKYDLQVLCTKLVSKLTNRTYELDSKDIDEIECIEHNYREKSFLWGRVAKMDFTIKRRIEGCGLIEIGIMLRGSLISKVEVTGDFFALGDANESFNNAFCNVVWAEHNIREAIMTNQPESSIRGLSRDDLLYMLTNCISNATYSSEN